MVAASFGVAFFVAVAQATAHVPGHWPPSRTDGMWTLTTVDCGWAVGCKLDDAAYAW